MPTPRCGGPDVAEPEVPQSGALAVTTREGAWRESATSTSPSNRRRRRSRDFHDMRGVPEKEYDGPRNFLDVHRPAERGLVGHSAVRLADVLVGRDATRAQCVHADPPGSQLQRRDLRQADDARLARAGRRVSRGTDSTEDQGQVDDAGPVFDQRGHGSNAKKPACQVHGEQAIPLERVRGLDVGNADDAGVC